MRRLPTSAIDPERKVKTMKVSVPIGPSSVLGWLAAAGGLITSTVQSIEGSHALASGPGKWPAILGMASLVATNLGRQLQAAGLPKAAAIAGDVGELPAALQSIARACRSRAPTSTSQRPRAGGRKRRECLGAVAGARSQGSQRHAAGGGPRPASRRQHPLHARRAPLAGNRSSSCRVGRPLPERGRLLVLRRLV